MKTYRPFKKALNCAGIAAHALTISLVMVLDAPSSDARAVSAEQTDRNGNVNSEKYEEGYRENLQQTKKRYLKSLDREKSSAEKRLCILWAKSVDSIERCAQK